MNNQWREHANCMVVWADKTYDTSRRCDYEHCGNYTCSMPVHNDAYKEKGETNLELLDRNISEEAATHGQSYWGWMQANKSGKRDFDGDKVVLESTMANPDELQETLTRTSGVLENEHEFMQEAYDLLTPAQKEVWDLVMREQLSQTDVAEKLGITRESVKSRLTNAKATVTNHLRSKQQNGVQE